MQKQSSQWLSSTMFLQYFGNRFLFFSSVSEKNRQTAIKKNRGLYSKVLFRCNVEVYHYYNTILTILHNQVKHCVSDRVVSQTVLSLSLFTLYTTNFSYFRASLMTLCSSMINQQGWGGWVHGYGGKLSHGVSWTIYSSMWQRQRNWLWPLWGQRCCGLYIFGDSYWLITGLG